MKDCINKSKNCQACYWTYKGFWWEALRKLLYVKNNN